MHELHGETATSVVPNDELAQLRLMQSAVEHAHDSVMIVDWPGGGQPRLIRYVNEAFTRITGYAREEVIGRNPMLLCGPNSDLAMLGQMLVGVLAGRPAVFELMHYRKDGSPIWLEFSIFPLQDGEGGVTHSITFGREAHAAFHDPLTGLPNRALFVDRVTSALARSGRRPEQVAAVLFLDCDRFKLVNDTLGHLTGDLLLIAIARRVERCLRLGDTLARLGSDEFTILLEDVQDAVTAAGIAEELLQAFSTPFTLGDHEVYATASIGIALSSPGTTSPEDLLRDADIAMYRAKVLGKGRYEVFVPELRAQASRLLQLETALRRTLDRSELSLAYQPIVSLADGRLSGFEALARWQHPEFGAIEPSEFIPVAEETGLIHPLGEWVLREACAQTRRWQEAFPLWGALSVSVNVSVKQLQDLRFSDRVRGALAQSGLCAQHLRLEITESMLMRDPGRAADALRTLRELGVKLHMDDFGTGYSSLSYLHQFPLDALKIDRSFVSGQGSAGIANPEIVQTVIAMARRLGLEVIAEGVETEEQERQLRALGCTSGQGYRFARPLDAPAAARYLDAAQAVRQIQFADSSPMVPASPRLRQR
jgi:diguanylate cyclase (GGDEF)-like protein/PAS domain S-box-containing protein